MENYRLDIAEAICDSRAACDRGWGEPHEEDDDIVLEGDEDILSCEEFHADDEVLALTIHDHGERCKFLKVDNIRHYCESHSGIDKHTISASALIIYQSIAHNIECGMTLEKATEKAVTRELNYLLSSTINWRNLVEDLLEDVVDEVSGGLAWQMDSAEYARRMEV